MKKTILLSIFLAFNWCNAQNILRENFSNYTTGSQLSGQGVWTNNSSNPGGLGTCGGFGCVNAKVLANTIGYTGFATTTINSFELKTDLDGCGRAFTAVASGDLLIGMVLNLSLTTATTTNDFFRVMSGGNFSSAFKMYAKSSGSGYVIGISKGASTTIVFSNTVLSLNQDNLIVLKYSILAGTSDDIVALYCNPTYANGTPATADATINSGTDQTGSIDRLVFRQNVNAGIPNGRVGLLSVAKTWEDLTFTILSTNDFQQSTFKINSYKAANGLLEINSNLISSNATLNIYSVLGNLLQTKKVDFEQKSNTISINSLTNAGVYIVEIVAESGARFSQKILVN